MSTSSSPFASVAAPAFRQGIRRRRDGPPDVEIQELDSRTMRQSAYNYFERHAVVPSLLRTSTFHSALGRSEASSKRQRTLAEHLDNMCLQDRSPDSVGSSRAAVASRDAQQYRECAREGLLLADYDARGQEGNASARGASGSASDGAVDHVEEGVQTVAELGRLRRFFAAHGSDRRRSIDRMYRHYVTALPQPAATTGLQGNELVVFRPRTTATRGSDMAAYLSLTPHDFDKLSTAEKRQWYQAHCRFMTELDAASAAHKKDDDMALLFDVEHMELNERRCVPPEHAMASLSSSCAHQVLEAPSDVEMMEVIEQDVAPKRRPQAAGALTHTEWFADADL
ncbi:unnamed protein product [Hyaloperonospora brassicae]|uniref:Uncharacterized protein n=1 Tax=Hyaloperonospora brassicae TaxID=162125 RepID=A0AAV0TMX4_HYABA|nr:unnamed protein product [Hyaloperonospora brassicae]